MLLATILFSLCKVYIVLCSTRHDDINFLAPRLVSSYELAAELISVVLNFVTSRKLSSQA